jgi:hypothetical protein
MTSYTVLLMYPSWYWDADLPETYLAHVQARDPVEASIKGHEQMAEDSSDDASKDAVTLFVTEGWHVDLTRHQS